MMPECRYIAERLAATGCDLLRTGPAPFITLALSILPTFYSGTIHSAHFLLQQSADSGIFHPAHFLVWHFSFQPLFTLALSILLPPETLDNR